MTPFGDACVQRLVEADLSCKAIGEITVRMKEAAMKLPDRVQRLARH